MSRELLVSDLIVLAGFLAVSIFIGLYQSCKVKDTGKDFINGERKLRLLPTVLSMMVSVHSAILILGNVAEIYRHGSQAWLWQTIGTTLGLLITERIFVPWLYPLQLTSVYEYIYKRYNSRLLRMLGSFLGVFSGVMYMSVAMIAPSIALQVAVDIPYYISIPLMGIVCTIYTSMGGMKAVIWTDVFQFLVIVGGMLAIMIKGVYYVGGFSNIFSIANEGKRIFWIKTDFDPTIRHTMWGFLFGWMPIMIQVYSLNQSSLQRYSSLPTLSKARLSILLNIPLIIVIPGMVYITGLSIYSYYYLIKCDPIASGAVKTGNEILPYYVSDMFANWWGFKGIFLALLYSGALSSVSSSLSGVAANIWMDFIKPHSKICNEAYIKRINQGLIILFGIIAVSLSFLVISMPGNILQVSLTLFSMVNGPLAGIYLLGGLTRVANWKGALVGSIAAMATMTWVTLGSVTTNGHASYLPMGDVSGCAYNFTEVILKSPRHLAFILVMLLYAFENTNSLSYGVENIYGISYLWYLPCGLIITFVIGIIVSMVTATKEDSKVDDRYLITTKYLFSFDYSEHVDENIEMEKCAGNTDIDIKH